jgi:ABC-2 type transport system permease protein
MYFGAFLGVSLAVSAKAGSSRVALIVLLGFWIFNGLIAPKAITDIARSLYPTPSALQFAKTIEQEMEYGIDGHNSADKRAEELKAKLLKQYSVSRVEDLPVDFAGLRMQAGEEYGNMVFDRHFSELWARYDRQLRLHEVASLVAPVLAIRTVSMGLSGTDFQQHAHFAKAAEDYRRLINREMNMDLANNAKGKPVYLANASVWEKIPDFRYTAPDLSWVLTRLTLSFSILLLWCGVAVAAASLTSAKMEVN